MNLNEIFESSINSVYSEKVALRQMSEFYANKAHRYSDNVLAMANDKLENRILPVGKFIIRSEDFYNAVHGVASLADFNAIFLNNIGLYTDFETQVYNNDTDVDIYGMTRLDRTLIAMVNAYGYTVTDILEIPDILAQFSQYDAKTIDDEIFYSDTAQGSNYLILYRAMYDFMSNFVDMGRWAEYLHNEVNFYEIFDIKTRSSDRYISLCPVTTKDNLFYVAYDKVLSLISGQGAIANITSEFLSTINASDNLTYMTNRINDFLANNNEMVPIISGVCREILSDTTTTALQKAKGWIHAFSSPTVADNFDAFSDVDKQKYTGVSLSQVVFGDLYAGVTQVYQALSRLDTDAIKNAIISVGSGLINAYQQVVNFTALQYAKAYYWCKRKFEKVVATVNDPVDVSINDDFEDSSFDEGYITIVANNASTLYPSIVKELLNHEGQYLCIPVVGTAIYLGNYIKLSNTFTVFLKVQLLSKHACSKVLSAFGISENALQQAILNIPNSREIRNLETNTDEVYAYQSLIYSKVLSYMFLVYLVKGFNYIYDKMNNSPTWYSGLFEDCNYNSYTPADVENISSVTNIQFINEILHYVDHENINSGLINFLDYAIGSDSEYIPYFTTSGQMIAKYHVLTDDQNQANAIHTLVIIASVVVVAALTIAGVALGVKLRHSTQEARWSADMLAFGEDPSKLDFKAIRKAQRKARFLESITGLRATEAASNTASLIGTAQKLAGQEDNDSNFTSAKDVFNNVTTKTQGVVTDLRGANDVTLSSLSTQVNDIPDNTSTINNINSSVSDVSGDIEGVSESVSDVDFNVGLVSRQLTDLSDRITAVSSSLDDLERKLLTVEGLIH